MNFISLKLYIGRVIVGQGLLLMQTEGVHNSVMLGTRAHQLVPLLRIATYEQES
jgi:hypothetical protein